jgi:hypothetical protein
MLMGVRMERDGRAMSNMDQESKEVHLLLEAWGAWSRDAYPRPFPEVSVIGRMIKYGALGASQEGKPPIAMPDPIARVDAAVARLGDIDKKVVQSYYLHWDPPESCAKRCHMRLRMFQNVLRRARWRIRINLDARNAHDC